MTPDEALKCAAMLEAHPQSIMIKLANANTIDEAQKFLDDVKKNARKQLRILAKDLHPDKTPDEEKHKLLKNLLQILEELEATSLDNFISHPQSVMFIQIIIDSPAASYWTPTTTTAYYK